ncbi:DUF3108 domain-containing protein [Nitrincola tibetensis]|uniref:DUF3108 domain-containing protein n=1 Tax=Nitrincola tibetensis TaxID=2219697 RepID=A0A364NN37_9GAMM|nr:DUF3108 domain-containing protein [Nitrincola tibetensis]RAU18444.1 DUF3108 domain-containing protein [Nitrincola tibetensis]
MGVSNKWLALATLLLLLSFSSMSSAQAPIQSLQPFKATYSSEIDAALTISGEASRELTRMDNGDWKLSAVASAMMARAEETTQIRLADGVILPIHYHYHRRILGKRRTAELKFDWVEKKVTTDIDDKPWKMDISPGVHDKLSYQLQIPIDLAAGKTRLSYPVADGGRLQNYVFNVTGQERISTPAGDYDAVRVERDRGENSDRETFIWLAPELNYMIIKLTQIEPDGNRMSLLLKELSVHE